MDGVTLDVRNPVARVELVPAAVEVLGDQSKLDDKNGRQIEWRRLASLFPPQTMEGLLVLAHYDPSIRTADKAIS
jgi:hypothetical protein